MTRALVLAMILLATPAHAGFKFYGPNGQTMNSTETEQQRERRVTREASRQQYIDGVRANTAIIASPRKKSRPICTPEELTRGTSCPRLVDEGPAPGGHRRHEWREKTGFNTPAERTRYRRAIWEEKERIRKEKAKPNPAGDHPSKIRKQFTPKF